MKFALRYLGGFLTSYLVTKAILYAVGSASLVAFLIAAWPILKVILIIAAAALFLYCVILIAACFADYRK